MLLWLLWLLLLCCCCRSCLPSLLPVAATAAVVATAVFTSTGGDRTSVVKVCVAERVGMRLFVSGEVTLGDRSPARFPPPFRPFCGVRQERREERPLPDAH